MQSVPGGVEQWPGIGALHGRTDDFSDPRAVHTTYAISYEKAHVIPDSLPIAITDEGTDFLAVTCTNHRADSVPEHFPNKVADARPNDLANHKSFGCADALADAGANSFSYAGPNFKADEKTDQEPNEMAHTSADCGSDAVAFTRAIAIAVDKANVKAKR